MADLQVSVVSAESELWSGAFDKLSEDLEAALSSALAKMVP